MKSSDIFDPSIFAIGWATIVPGTLTTLRPAANCNRLPSHLHHAGPKRRLLCPGISLTCQQNRIVAIIPVAMTYPEAYRYYLAALREDPRTPAPALRVNTVDDYHAWKAEMRAFDAARLELKLATPQEIQEENAAIQVRGRPWRVVEHAQHP